MAPDAASRGRAVNPQNLAQIFLLENGPAPGATSKGVRNPCAVAAQALIHCRRFAGTLLFENSNPISPPGNTHGSGSDAARTTTSCTAPRKNPRLFARTANSLRGKSRCARPAGPRKREDYCSPKTKTRPSRAKVNLRLALTRLNPAAASARPSPAAAASARSRTAGRGSRCASAITPGKLPTLLPP